MTQTHSTAVGYLLWLFGFTGAHRFYFGKPLTGTLWLCTGGLLGIGWLIDIFLIPGMDRAAERRYRTGSRDYTVAWALQTFLGIFGIHRFYLGNVRSPGTVHGRGGISLMVRPTVATILIDP